jgi:hypothetical protein
VAPSSFTRQKTIEGRGNGLDATETLIAKFLFKVRRRFTAKDRQANGFVPSAQEHDPCPPIHGWHAVPNYYDFISGLDGALSSLPKVAQKPFHSWPKVVTKWKCFGRAGVIIAGKLGAVSRREQRGSTKS